MHREFQLPHITGKTTQEQLSQVISYLRQLALLLQQLPEQQTQKVEAAPQQLRGNRFSGLTVRNSLVLGGDINGIYLGTRYLYGTQAMYLQTAFSEWNPAGTEVQTLVLIGSLPGCLQVQQTGQCNWIGGGDVTVTPGEKGAVVLTFPQPLSENIMILSTHSFR